VLVATEKSSSCLAGSSCGGIFAAVAPENAVPREKSRPRDDPTCAILSSFTSPDEINRNRDRSQRHARQSRTRECREGFSRDVSAEFIREKYTNRYRRATISRETKTNDGAGASGNERREEEEGG